MEPNDVAAMGAVGVTYWLSNAINRIEKLESQVASLKKELADHNRTTHTQKTIGAQLKEKLGIFT